MTKISDAIRETLSETRLAVERGQKALEMAKRIRFAWANGVETLYKFKSLKGDSRGHTLDIIENSRIYFPGPDEFNDPLDCAPVFELAGDLSDPKFIEALRTEEQKQLVAEGLSPAQIDALRASHGVDISKMAEAVTNGTRRLVRSDVRILCLCAELCHPLLWSHYAEKHSGICLHFRCDSETMLGLARQVNYQAERFPILIPLCQPEDDVTDRMTLVKAEFWGHESEYRILAHLGAPWGYDFDEAHRVSFPPELLCGITLGLKTSDADRADVLSLAVARNPAIPVWEAFEDPKRFWMLSRRVR